MNKKPRRRAGQNTRRKSSDSNAKTAAAKLGKSEEELEDEDRETAKEVSQPPLLLEVLLGKKICLFPGIKDQRLGEDSVDFTDYLPLLGGCGVLIFCELNRTRTEIKEHVAQQVGREHGGVQTRMYTPADLDFPLPETDQLFPECMNAPLDWVPDDAKPPMDQFWALWSIFGIGIPGCEQKTLHLLHLGIGGEAAWLYFLQPHNIRVARVIMNSPHREMLEAP
jgi:hypothetical protein